MLDYDYLARPVQARAADARGDADGRRTAARPTSSASKKGIYFTPDPAFKGKPRELTAADYAYGFKRLLDPAVKSRRGCGWSKARSSARDEARAKARRRPAASTTTRRSPGLEVVDRYTLRIRLTQPDLRFLVRARGAEHGRAVAREVVEALRARLRRASGRHRAVHARRVQAQRAHRARRQSGLPRRRRTCPPGPMPAGVAAGRRSAQGAGSCRSPGRIEIRVIEEGQARWLAFLNREVDLLERPAAVEFIDEALVDGKLQARRSRRRASRTRCCCGPNTWWTYFNMEDPVVGGYTPEKIALRRAIGMAYDDERRHPRAAEGPRGARAEPDSARTSPATTRS